MVQMSAGRRAVLIVCLGILNALTPFTIDLYLPSFDDIARDLATTVPSVSLSVATYFVGFALGQILYGPLFDRFGRKPPIFVGLALYLAATVGCLTAQSVQALWVFRFLAALGGSAASVGTVAMVRDFFKPSEAPKVFSMLMLVLSVSPLFAPSAGAWIAASFGWRATFAVLAGLAVVDLGIVLFALPKAYEPDPSFQLRASAVLRTFRDLLAIPAFRAYSVAGALSFAGLFVYVSSAPGIFISGYGTSKETFGLIFASLATGMIGGGQVNNLLMKRYESAAIFRAAVAFQVAVGWAFLASSLAFELPLAATLAFLFAILSANGVAYPNAAALALKPIERNVGSASSLMGFIQMSLGATLASTVGLVAIPGPRPAALVLAASSAGAAAVLWLSARQIASTKAQAAA